MKSLYVFEIETGALSANRAGQLQTLSIKNVLAERMLDEDDVRRLIRMNRRSATARSCSCSTALEHRTLETDLFACGCGV